MSILGRWTGAVIGTQQPGLAWAVAVDLFPTEQRNDGSVYSFAPATSTLTLPSSDLADGYLLRAQLEFDNVNTARVNISGRFAQIAGSGNFLSFQTSGYARAVAERRLFVQVVAFVDGPGAGDTFNFQWIRDTDAPGADDGTMQSSFEVIPFFYSNVGMYTSTTPALLGGIAPNTVAIETTVAESDSAAIERIANTVTVKGDGTRYLIMGNVWGDGFSVSTRTERVIALGYAGSEDSNTRSYFYSRYTAASICGALCWDIKETVTDDVAVELLAWRGDGIAAFEGGAEQDGNVPSEAHNALIVLELNTDTEVFRTKDATASQELAVTGPVDMDVVRADQIDFSDAASWIRANDSQMNAVVAMDALVGANIFAAQGGTTGSRWSARAHITEDGIEDGNTAHGNYQRNTAGNMATYGWAAQPGGYMALAAGGLLGVSVQEVESTFGGGGDVETQGVSFWGINLDTMAVSAIVVGDIAIAMAAITLAGSVPQLAIGAAGSVSVDVDSIPLAGSAEALSVSAGEVSADIGSISLVGSVEPLAVSPEGLASVNLDSIALIGAAEALRVEAGGVSADIGSISVVGLVEPLAVSPEGSASVSLDSISLIGSAETLQVVPGEVGVAFSSLSLSSSLETLQVTPGEVAVAIDSISVVGLVEPLAVSPEGSASVSLDSISLIGSAEALRVIPGEVGVAFNSLSLSSSLGTLQVTPGEVAVAIDSISLTSTLETILVRLGSVSIMIDSILLDGVVMAIPSVEVEVLLARIDWSIRSRAADWIIRSRKVDWRVQR